MADYAGITLIGRLSQEPKVHETKNGSVTNFNLAVGSLHRGEEVTNFYRVAVFGKQGEAVAQYLTKGSPATVIGELIPNDSESDGRTFHNLDVRANRVVFGAKSENSEARREAPQSESKRDFGGQEQVRRPAPREDYVY